MSTPSKNAWSPCENCRYYENGKPCASCHLFFLNKNVYQCENCIDHMMKTQTHLSVCQTCKYAIMSITIDQFRVDQATWILHK